MSESLEKADLYLKEAHIDFDFVHSVRRRIDDKIHNMIVLSGVLVNLLLGLAYFLFERNLIKQYTLSSLSTSMLLYFLVVVVGLASYEPLDVSTVGVKEVIKEFEKKNSKTDLLSVKQALAYNISCDAQKNQEIIIKKAKRFHTMSIVFAFGLLSLFVALISLAF